MALHPCFQPASLNSLPHSPTLVISKETVGNSWDISSAILGHKYHQNHSNRSSEWSQHLQQNWLIQSVNGESINCFTDISTEEACTVTQKLDLNKISGRSIHILKDTYIQLHSLSVANFGFIPFIYILGKWLQKEDIAETAVHFVLKWGFEVNPVSNNSRVLETEDFGDIASAHMPLKRGL